MKKAVISILLVGLMGGAMVGCSSKSDINTNLSAVEIVDTLLVNDYIVAPREVTDEEATEIYHLNLADVESYKIAETERSPGPGLIIVVKAKDGKVDEVKASLEQVLEDMVNKAFYPDEQEAAENAEINVDGNYVSLFILNSEVQSDAYKLYNEQLGK